MPCSSRHLTENALTVEVDLQVVHMSAWRKRGHDLREGRFRTAGACCAGFLVPEFHVPAILIRLSLCNMESGYHKGEYKANK